MDTPIEFLELSRAPVVYVRPVAPEDQPADVRSQSGGRIMYAVHSETGERLALVADRKLAFVLARQHDMAPVHVH